MRAARAVALLALLVGCQGLGVHRDELGERRFALHWFDVETQRRRAEMVQDADPAREKVGPRGTAHIDAFSEYLGRVFGVADPEGEAEGSLHARQSRRFPGRLALVQPRDGHTELLPATPGAMPRAWSPDGQRLLFSQLVGRFQQLFVYDLGTRTLHPVTHGPQVHPDGCFGPQERLVLVSVGVEEGGLPYSRLELTEPGGTRPGKYTEGPSDFEAACARDGSAVAWVRVDEHGRDQLMTRSPALDGPLRRLGPGRFPAFSPDSEWIVYSRLDRAGRWALQRIRADGSGRRPVGAGTRNEIHPTFSPDGRLVLYVSDNGYDERIYVRRFDGTGDRILMSSGGGTDPVW
ncbi:MAG: PD40 domain-containing protein [Deltaproteobacteria bacterium]|nr:PD40 domain-containing protein [Deltaproteobacteria bacterium]MBW2362141.1 PD40 domain-containing protein [Deltaproteobacteria bacterium]